MINAVIYAVAFGCLGWSWRTDRDKSKHAMKAAKGLLRKTLVEMLTVIALIALVMTLIPQDLISRLMGSESGLMGVITAAAIGTVSLIPGFVAFPLAGSLHANGASYAAIAAFITTLTMVGIVTAPLEIRYLGRQITIWRNGLSFIMALLIAAVLGVLL